ncbi:AsmA family protein [Nitratireductor basaltis]|uniref:AsmA n=1 Tax=Nitratireductor basaltis TaxID=472175 RepID=A0A084UDR9_9HYPH|nr:AsmA-like C-terminal region-containing protein [Nitratireductor basaltis]KFB11105.1 AsmA precursor [Nitratireductor basaltis]
MSLARKAAWSTGIVVVIALLLMVGLPLIASTQIVRDGIANQMSSWSGYRVRLDDTPEIEVWPTFRAVLNDVTLLDWNTRDPQPVVEAVRVEVELSALAALRGDVVFTRMRFIRPLVRLHGDRRGYHLPSPRDWGRLARSVEQAEQMVAQNGEAPAARALPDDPLGAIEFVDGRVIGAQSGTTQELITSLSGTLDWPALNRQASLNAKGIWRGEAVDVQVSSAQPLLLLAGSSAAVDLSVRSSPLNLSFKGTANLSGVDFFDGDLSASTPSLGRVMEWMQGVPAGANRVGPVSIAARMTGQNDRLKFENAALTVDESSAKGLLEIAFEQGEPSISGTLAFDQLNLRSTLNTFAASHVAVAARDGEGSVDQRINVDMRFSVVNATYGSIALANVAAAAKSRDGLATFDISDATAFGGSLQMGLRVDRTGSFDTLEVSFSGEQVDTAMLAQKLQVSALLPRARGSFSLSLKGTGRTLDEILSSADGNITAEFGKGEIPGIHLPSFMQLSERGDFFALSEISEGALPVDTARLKATVRRGVADIETAEARSPSHVLELDGLVPFAGRGLALYGTLTDERTPEAAPLMFFVGGSWASPFIAAFNPDAPREQ